MNTILRYCIYMSSIYILVVPLPFDQNLIGNGHLDICVELFLSKLESELLFFLPGKPQA